MIIHSRKTELRCFVILQEISIARRFSLFRGMKLREHARCDLSFHRLLSGRELSAMPRNYLSNAFSLKPTGSTWDRTEDALNEPSNVPVGVEAMAKREVSTWLR